MLNLTAPLLYSYAGNVTQVIRVPEYTNVTINAGRSISPSFWNGSVGGVVAFLATGTLSNSGLVDARGRGFLGGQPVDDPSGTTGCSGVDELAPSGGQKGEGIASTRYGATVTGRGRVGNGGAGGVCFMSGGGGGGNGGIGGQGGNTEFYVDGNRLVGGEGGASVTYSLLNHLTLGGGGGAGHSTDVAAGAGGGIIFVRAGALSLAGNFLANGNTSTFTINAGNGGGAGGTIYLRVAGSAACSSVQAAGGSGGNTGSIAVGPGGGGGGGHVLFQKGSGSCTLTVASVLGANPGTQLDPGAPGGASYGATAGANGVTFTPAGGFTVLPAPVVNTPLNGSRTDNVQPTYSGTISVTPALPAGTEIVVYVDGAEVGRTTADGLGNWTFTPPGTIPALTAGAHSVYAVAINTEQGVQSASSNTNTFTVDLTPPAVVVTTPVEGSRTNDTTSTYSGMVSDETPGPYMVAIRVDGTLLTTLTVPGPTWTFTPTVPLAEGAHTVTATATDPAGNTATDSNGFTVDVTPPTVSVATPAEGSITNNATPTYSGTVEADATVSISVDSVVLGNATVTGTAWTFTPIVPLLEGSHTVTATATDAAGNTATDSNTLTVDTTPPAAPVVSTPANSSPISDNTPTYSGTAGTGSTVTIIVDGLVMGSTTAGATGRWSLTPPSPLADGPHTVKAFAANLGGTGPDSSTLIFTIIRDPRTGGWSTTGDLVTVRTGHTATVLPSGKVLVIGGEGSSGLLRSAELYDPGTGGWSTTGDLATARTGHTATVLPSGKVLVIAGEGSSGGAERTAPAAVARLRDS